MIYIIDPNIEENIPKKLNEIIENSPETEKYLMFVYKDLSEQIKDKDIFLDKYTKLLETYSLPYAFYPYYIHFNKVLQSSLSFATPRMRFSIGGVDSFDIVNQTAYGMLIINKEMLKTIDFKFNETFKKSFYIQELIETCFSKNLYYSDAWFFDVVNSFELVNSNMKDGYKVDVKDFSEEKTKFYSVFPKIQPESPTDFINKIKSKYMKVEKEVLANPEQTGQTEQKDPLKGIENIGDVK